MDAEQPLLILNLNPLKDFWEICCF